MEVIISLVILSLVIWFVYWIIDSSGSKQFGHGVVVGKKFTPAHMQTTYVTTSQSDGRGGTITSTYPQITWIPDSYVLRIRIAGDMPSTSVSEEVYESFNEGDSIPVKYSQGRLSKDKIYIKRLGITLHRNQLKVGNAQIAKPSTTQRHMSARNAGGELKI
ncbi:MAG: hypothetical protein HC769_32680 [Cyanobacteria bacterium CRU_2_1]|nr:hypothetical protein [Cyanobacteria bacterium CRU_2_1]